MCGNCEFLLSIHTRKQKTWHYSLWVCITQQDHVDVKTGLPLKRSWLENKFEKKFHINLLVFFLGLV
jgi:hypothetical protein